MKDSYRNLIYLIKAGLGEEVDVNNFRNLDMEEIFKLSISQSVCNIVLYGIDNLELKIDKKLYDKWNDIREQEIMKDVMQQEEGNALIEELNNKNIDFALLKGWHLKKMYPSTDMRSMGDIDLLIKSSKRELFKDVMTSMGYDTVKYKKDNEDVYYKLPVYNIEAHVSLFERKSLYYHYYTNIWKDLVKKDKHEYEFSCEDFYIFIIAHLAKHYFHCGAGIRNIVDIYLYNKKYKLDMKYVNKKLKEYELYEFHNDLVEVIDCMFNNCKINNKNLEMISYIFESDTYGKEENVYLNNKKKYKNKFDYFIHRTFLPVREMKNHYPILNKVIILLPIFWIFRLVSSVIKSPRGVFKEFIKIMKG